MFRWLVELWRLSRIVRRYRHLSVGRASKYAEVSMRATELVEVLRRRYDGKNFAWTFPTNHMLDSFSEYVAMWQIVCDTMDPIIEMRFMYCGPCGSLAGLIDKGHFDRSFLREDAASALVSDLKVERGDPDGTGQERK